MNLLELATGLGIVAILTALAIPELRDLRDRTLEAEVHPNVRGLQAAELGYAAAYDEFVYVADMAPDAYLSDQFRDWPTGSRFDLLGWAPDGAVIGAYIVYRPSNTDFVVMGHADAGSDGMAERCEADRDEFACGQADPSLPMWMFIATQGPPPPGDAICTDSCVVLPGDPP